MTSTEKIQSTINDIKRIFTYYLEVTFDKSGVDNWLVQRKLGLESSVHDLMRLTRSVELLVAILKNAKDFNNGGAVQNLKSYASKARSHEYMWKYSSDTRNGFLTVKSVCWVEDLYDHNLMLINDITVLENLIDIHNKAEENES